MEQSPYQRLELFWQHKGLKNATAFAESVKGLTPAALSAMKHRRSTPGTSVLRAIQLAYPDLNGDYLLWGTGPMLRDGRALSQLPPPVPSRLPDHFEEVERLPGVLAIARFTPEEVASMQAELVATRRELASAQQTIERLWDQNTVLIKKPSASADAADLYADVDALAAQLHQTQQQQHRIAAQAAYGAVRGRWVSLSVA